ncbi:uncharacterized protein BCR38DRAFT_444435 [Pseudomassariella vexata]|uniref:J domain-containing protein n=1 Tax=Pseudomassariella vexata TaxID=1141098 RepID=A0A1Y2DLW9_9PEZI|nr:uncharacterized protein BCR38DRAFT_444435 [Pseudomassariella vexata]ORY60262.1 hypothetical protein BCR38DRAFT_444435 [Pseudomassariella vexata]
MRLPILSISLLALLTPLTSAWSKEDQEIFRVRDELAAHEGPDVSFYDFLGVTPSASQDEINKAYKKRTKALHPDKVKQRLAAERATQAKENKSKKKPGVTVTKPPSQAEIKAAIKSAGDKQARLGVVVGILRGSGRARYDHFISNGFPVWKGTGYYYSRYRPGLGTVLVGCFIAGGGMFHYVALYMSWKRQREFVERYIKFARHAAWGDNLAIPGVEAGATATPPPEPAGDEQAPMMAVNRKQRRMQERDAKKENAKEGKRMGRGRGGRPDSGSATPVPQTLANNGSGPTGAKKRVVAENGKILVVDSLGDVYLEQEMEDGKVEEFLLDPNELPQPTIRDTALYRLPIWAYQRTMARVLGKHVDGNESLEKEFEDGLTDDDSDAPQRTPSTDSAEDFELLDTTKSVEDLVKKASGSQSQGSGKVKKRNKKK